MYNCLYLKDEKKILVIDGEYSLAELSVEVDDDKAVVDVVKLFDKFEANLTFEKSSMDYYFKFLKSVLDGSQKALVDSGLDVKKVSLRDFEEIKRYDEVVLGSKPKKANKR